MRVVLLLCCVIGGLACTSKGSDSKPSAPALEPAPGALARPPSADRLPDDLRPPREQ